MVNPTAIAVYCNRLRFVAQRSFALTVSLRLGHVLGFALTRCGCGIALVRAAVCVRRNALSKTLDSGIAVVREYQVIARASRPFSDNARDEGRRSHVASATA